MMPPSQSSRRADLPPLPYRILHGVMCPVMKLFGLSCRQFAEITARRMDRPLSRLEAARFRFHRALCGLCRPLPAQLENLRILTRRCCEAEAHEDAAAADACQGELSPEALERLREVLAGDSTREGE